MPLKLFRVTDAAGLRLSNTSAVVDNGREPMAGLVVSGVCAIGSGIFSFGPVPAVRQVLVQVFLAGRAF